MGVFDYRCAITGLSTQATGVVLPSMPGLAAEADGVMMLVLVEHSPGKWSPVAPPVRGHYDGYGRVELLRPNGDAERVAAFFLDALTAGRATLAGHAALDAARPPAEVFDGEIRSGFSLFAHLLERATTMSIWSKDQPEREGFWWKGQRIAQALVLAPVWDAIARAALPSSVSPFDTQLAQALHEGEPKDGRAIAQYAAVRGWFESRADWKPGSDASQHSDRDHLTQHLDALDAWGDVQFLRAAIDSVANAREQRDDSYPPGWLMRAPTSWYGVLAGGEKVACSSVAQVRAATERVLAAMPEELVDAPAAILTVRLGRVVDAIDLKPSIHVKTPAGQPLLGDSAAWKDAERAEVTFNWDELEVRLKPLDGPVRTTGTPAFLPGADSPPFWMTRDDQWGLVVFEPF